MLIDLDKDYDVLVLIKEHHRLLNQSVQILKNEKIPAFIKQENLSALIDLLKAHTKAEEQTIYKVLQDIQESQLVTFEAIEEHAVAKILIDELEDLDFTNIWNNEVEAKAKALAEFVENHIEDEEKFFFEKARLLLTREERIIVGTEFHEKFMAVKDMKDKVIRPIRKEITSGYFAWSKQTFIDDAFDI